MIWLVIVTKPIDWLGGGVRARKQSYIEKRRLSFMYFIVDKMIILLSARFMIGWPYIYRCDWFPKWFRLYFCKICITLLAKVALWIAKKGHKNRKWLVSLIPLLQRHISEGVSMKLWHFLWYLKGLRPTLNWSRYELSIIRDHLNNIKEPNRLDYDNRTVKRFYFDMASFTSISHQTKVSHAILFLQNLLMEQRIIGIMRVLRLYTMM